MSELTADRLQQVLVYNKFTGVFHWVRRGGKIAGSVNKRGYRTIKVDGRHYKAHRLAWLYVTGSWPAGIVDHENQIPDDNWFDNLRSVTQAVNCRNQRLSSANTSGRTGVHFNNRLQKWQAQIRLGGETRQHLGVFDSFEDACAARTAAEAAHGFHPNHGKDRSNG